jgi:hypothetical protein
VKDSVYRFRDFSVSPPNVDWFNKVAEAHRCRPRSLRPYIFLFAAAAAPVLRDEIISSLS